MFSNSLIERRKTQINIKFPTKTSTSICRRKYLKIDPTLIDYTEEKMSIRFCLVQNQINQNNLHPSTPPPPKKIKIKLASQESNGYKNFTMNSHSMYSSATASQFACNRNIFFLKKKGKVGKFKMENKIYKRVRERFTHLMSRMLPGEYWTKRVSIGNPHSTHLCSIFFNYSLAR